MAEAETPFLSSLPNLNDKILYLRKRCGYGDNKFSENDLRWLILMAEQWDLDIAKRELYLLPAAGEMRLHVGYQVYIRKAIQSGKCAGFSTVTYSEAYGKFHIPPIFSEWTERNLGKTDEPPKELSRIEILRSMIAEVTIARTDWKDKFIWTTHFPEVEKSSPIWKAMPIFMLKKTALTQAFRICFADVVGGFPYTEEETGD